MRKEKGITLIALIITIIVMLILVAVTLSITLGENGIVKKAQSAKQQQEREVARERVQACLSFDSTGQVDIGETVASLQRAGGKTTSSSTTEITVEMDGYTFTISKNGNVVFEGTNGTHNHVDENNDGYCDNCGEYISNEGYGYTGEEIIETGILDGTYYRSGNRGHSSMSYQIAGNRFRILDGSGNEEYTFTINENNNTIVFNGEDVVINYEITSENKILIIDGDSLFATTTNGFEYGLNGEYINATSTSKRIFDSLAHEVQELWNDGTNWHWSRTIDFCGYNGAYYVNGQLIPSSDNYQSFTYYDTTYTKAN